MKIICAGICKTGTKSLARALRILGYTVYDYDDQVCELADLWTKFLNGTVTDEEIRKSLEEVDVLVDGPVIALWEEIHRAIPEAKVIMTTRDEDSWWQSVKGMYRKHTTWQKALVAMLYLTPTGSRIIRTGVKCSNLCYGIESILPAVFLSDNPRLYKYKFRKHNGHVMKAMEGKGSNFLLYKVEDGWEPLCKFLGKEIPSGVPYPHLNKSRGDVYNDAGPQNKKFKRAMNEAGFALVVLISLCVFILCILLHWLSSSF